MKYKEITEKRQLTDFLKIIKMDLIKLWDYKKKDNFANEFKLAISKKYEDLIYSNKSFDSIKLTIEESNLEINNFLIFVEKYKTQTSTNHCLICALAKYMRFDVNDCKYIEYKECVKKIINEYNQEIYKDNPFRVLVLEGGGILGYYQIKLLQSLNKNNKDIGKLFDLICGTSTGSIIASGLAKENIKPEEICNLYKDNAKSIFPEPIPTNGFKKIIWAIKYMNKSSSNQDILKDKLKKIFNNLTLKELSKEKNTHICITSIDLNNNLPKIFKSYNDSGSDYLVADVCLASSAAPIYFNDYKIGKTSYVDGGLWANNPILISIIESLKISKSYQNIEIFRLSPPNISNADVLINKNKNKNKGLLYWKFGLKIIDSSIEAQSYGFTDLAKKYSKFINSLNSKEIKIFNFKSSNLTKQDFEEFRLDNSSDSNFELMDQLIIRIIKSEEQEEEIKKLFN